jgi:hypothetical protein
MNQTEFYSKAQLDPRFRAEKIEEARYQKKIAVGFAVVIAVGWLSYLAYCEIAEKRWPGDGGVFLVLVLCASSYGQARTKLGALQAMQSKQPNQRPERNAGAASPSTSTPLTGVAHP